MSLKRARRMTHDRAVDLILSSDKRYRTGVSEALEQMHLEEGAVFSEAVRREARVRSVQRYDKVVGKHNGGENPEARNGEILVRRGIVQGVGGLSCEATIVRQLEEVHVLHAVGMVLSHLSVGLLYKNADGGFRTGTRFDNAKGVVQRGYFLGNDYELGLSAREYNEPNGRKYPAVEESLLGLGRLDVVLSEVVWDAPFSADPQVFFARA